MNHPEASSPARHGGSLLAVLLAAFVYLTVRLTGMFRTQALFNQDSINYVQWARVYRNWDWERIVSMNPDATPLYPLLTALLSYVTGDVEAAARWVSLLSSCAVAVAVYLLGRRLANPACGAIAVLLLAVNPVFVRFSYAEMTEMLYVALFTWIAFVVISDVRQARLCKAVVLGSLCGLAFLNRVEAILLVVAIPVIYWSFALVSQPGQARRPIAWSNIIVITVMLALAAPQVMRVSQLMDSFALNGRDAWAKILAVPDGKSYDEKLAGLDFDPHTINLVYLQQHPQALDELVGSTGYMRLAKEYATSAVKNIKTLHDSRIAGLMGIPVLVFSVIGFLSLLRNDKAADSILLSGFALISMIAPIMYTLAMRHLVIVLPFVAVFAAAGIRDVTTTLSTRFVRTAALSPALLGIIVSIAIAVPVADLLKMYKEAPTSNPAYTMATLREPISLVERQSEMLARPATVMSRKSYLPYFANARREVPPYTSLSGLLTYMNGLSVDFFYYEEQHLSHYPFAADIGSEAWQEYFEKIHSVTWNGYVQSLYAVR